MKIVAMVLASLLGMLYVTGWIIESNKKDQPMWIIGAELMLSSALVIVGFILEHIEVVVLYVFLTGLTEILFISRVEK